MSMMSAPQLHASRDPLVSIGMPVYNSAAWVESAIDSLLAQTFGDFELVISDNASTDATLAICEHYAKADPRIRILRNKTNLGANPNYLAVLAVARGTYFKWASSNDVCAPTFIEKCVRALEADPSAVLACPRSWLFDNSIDSAQPYDRDIELTGTDASERLIDLHLRMGLNNAFNGVIRRNALLRASLMGSYMGADIVLMSELALLGRFLLIEERLFYRRMSPEAATKLKSDREIERHLAPTARAPLKWQAWQFHLGLVKACRLVRFPSRAWLRATSYSVRSFVWARRKLAGEVMRALRPEPVDKSIGAN